MASAGGNVRAPVTFQLNASSPIRGSVAAPPYTIINLSVDSTVWIADNPGMAIRQGTPLYPGTSIKWTRPGDLWMIADVACQVVVSYDVEDWQPNPAAIAAAILNSGVLIIDRPINLFNGATVDTGNLDISRYQSLSLGISPPAAGTYGTARVLFLDTIGVIIDTIDLQFAPMTIPVGWFAEVPAAGSHVRIITSYATNVGVTASNRPKSHMTQNIGGSLPPVDPSRGYGLWTEGAALIGPGISYNADIRPWFGEIEINCIINAAGAVGNSACVVTEWTPSVPAGGYQLAMGRQFGGTVLTAYASYGEQLKYNMNGSSIRIQVFNGFPGNANVRLFVRAVTGYN